MVAGTVVRTATGTKKIEHVVVGDRLRSELDELVAVTSIDEPRRASVSRIMYRQFESSKPAFFECCTNHLLALAACEPKPTLLEKSKEVR